MNLWQNFLFSKSNLKKKFSQNIPNNPFYLKKHMRWTRRSLSSTINSNCTKLILKKIVLTQVLIWKGHFFFVFLPSNKFFLTCLTIIFHSCAYYFCVLFMKRVNTTICVMGRTQVKQTIWTTSNLTSRSLNSNSSKKQTLNMFGQKWAVNLLCCYKSGFWIMWILNSGLMDHLLFKHN